MVFRIVAAALVILVMGVPAVAQYAPPVVTVAGITRADVKQLRRLSGTVSSYKAPATDRAPHAILLQDATGFIRVAIWNDIWTQIPFREQLKVAGAPVTVTVEIAEFRGNLEGHLNRADDISGGQLATPVGAPAQPVGTPKVLSADPIPWQGSLTAAMAQARQTNRKILVFFENRDINVSREMDVGVFADLRVRAAVQAKYVPVKLNMAADAELARKLGVFQAGVIAFYNADGTAITHVKGVSSAEEILRIIAQH